MDRTPAQNAEMRLILQSIMNKQQNSIGFDLDLVARDFGIHRVNFETQRDYMLAFLAWVNDVWKIMPENQLRRYYVASPGAVNMREQFFESIPNGSTHPGSYGEFLGIHPEQVQRASGVKQEHYRSNEAYERAVAAWFYTVRPRVAKRNAVTIAFKGSVSTAEYWHPLG